jgi:hypothetical protein
MTPSDSETTDRLRSLVDAIAVPNTILGPVAFFRRIRSGETKKDGGLGMPFLQHVRAAGPVWLDDVITSALPALPPPPTKSIWNRWSKRDRDKPKHIVSFVPEDEVTPMMSRRLNVPVIICNGRISLN